MGAQESSISAVRLQINVNDTKGCRKITLKGIYGDRISLKRFIDSFKARLQTLGKHDSVRNSTTK